MDYNSQRKSLRHNNDNKKRFDLLFLIWSIVRPILVILTCIMLCFSIFYGATDLLLNRFLLPVDAEDITPIQVVIKRGSSVGSIANTLKDYDLIKNSTVFEYYIDFSGYGSKMRAGEYVFNKQMTMEEIMEKLAKGDGKSIVTTFTIIEGSTIESMAETLVDDGIISNEEIFLSLAKDGKEFLSYSFIAEIDNDEATDRKYVMEGYLFPDKFEIYVGSSEATIMKKMLNKFDAIMGEKYISRAEELGLTIDEIMTLASIIQKEAKPDDFAKVSAVFHNRLDENMKLESCVTVQYILDTKKLNLSADDISVESPYNTYQNSGLPMGPICSPSLQAIEAALYPNEEFRADGYLFFTTKDPTSGELEFSITYSDHAEAVEEYRPLWEAYDAENGN